MRRGGGYARFLLFPTTCVGISRARVSTNFVLTYATYSNFKVGMLWNQLMSFIFSVELLNFMMLFLVGFALLCSV